MTKTMRQALAECSDEQFKQIMHLWGMDGETEHLSEHFYETLKRHMQDPIAARFVWEYLAPDERQALYRGLTPSARYGIQRDSLQKKSQLAPETFEAAVANLIYYMLLQSQIATIQSTYVVYANKTKKETTPKKVPMVYAFNESVEALYAAGRELLTPSGDRSTLTFDKLLSTLNETDLYQIFRSYAVQWESYYSRADFRAMIVDKLLELEEPLDFLPQLDKQAGEVFKWLRQKGGRASMQEVRTHTGANDANLLKLLQALASCALAFDTFSSGERVLFIPREFYESMREIRQSTQKSSFDELETPPQIIQAAESTTLYDLATLIGTMYQMSIEPTQAGTVPKRLAAKIRPLLHGLPRETYDSEDDYLELLCRTARELHLLQLSQSPIQDIKSHYEPGPQLKQWSQMDSTEQTKRLLEYWPKSYSWRDIYGANFEPWNPYSWNSIAGRETLLTQLRTCTPGRWYTIASLLQRIWEDDPFAMRPAKSYTRTTDRRKTEENHKIWLHSEGEAYAGMLHSTLCEFGIVTTGYGPLYRPEAGRSINPSYFMLTELGAAVLSADQAAGSTSEPGSDARTLVVQPNFELLLLLPDLPTLYNVLPFAQVNQVGVVSRLTLTRTSILRGLEAGRNIEQIIQTLEAHSQKELPQNVLYTLKDWVKFYKEARISQVLLLEVSSEAVAQQLCALSKLQDFGLRQIAPCMLIMNSDISMQDLKRILDKEGITQHLTGGIVSHRNRYDLSYGRSR